MVTVAKRLKTIIKRKDLPFAYTLSLRQRLFATTTDSPAIGQRQCLLFGITDNCIVFCTSRQFNTATAGSYECTIRHRRKDHENIGTRHGSHDGSVAFPD